MRRAAHVLSAAAAVTAAGLVAAGCGTGGIAGKKADTAHGKELFVQKCGSCHTLADAGTKGAVGPNLDDAFAGPRAEGFPESSIRNVVRGQILYPVSNPAGVVEGPDGERRRAPGMPAKLVTGDDARDVAAYVASVAGTAETGGTTEATATAAAPPTTEPQETSPTATDGGSGDLVAQGKRVFQSAGCGSCHALADAAASGSVGPNLDETKPAQALVADLVANGKGVMPSFKSSLTSAEIEAVAAYVSAVAGG